MPDERPDEMDVDSVRPSETPPTDTRLRVAMLAHSYYPGDVRIKREARALVDAGHEVDVFCLTSSMDTTTRERVDGVEVHRLRAGRVIQHSRVPYLFEYAAAFAGLFWRLSTQMQRRHYDVVQVHTLPDALVFATVLAKVRGARVILDMHDLMPELYMSKYGLRKESIGVRLLRWTERLSTGFADHVITASELFRDRLVASGVPERKVTVVLNTADSAVFPLVDPESRTRKQDRFTVFWHGTMVRRYGLDLAVEAMASLRNVIPGLRLVIYGHGECAEEIAELVEALHLADTVELRGYAPHAELVGQMAAADLGVVPNRPDPHIEMAYPTKLLEFVQMGIPVVSTRTTVLARLFTDDSIVSVDDNPEGVAEGIAWVYGHEQEAKERAVRAQSKCEPIEWKRMRRVYLGAVERVGSGRTSRQSQSPTTTS